MKKSIFKRISAVLICICMLFTLMPVIPASAADASTKDLTIYGTTNTVAVDSSFTSGLVLRLEDHAFSNGTTGVKVTVGLHNVDDYLMSHFLRIRYNEEIVRLAIYANGGTITDANKNLAVTGAEMPAEMSAAFIEEAGFAKTTATIAGGTYGLWTNLTPAFYAAEDTDDGKKAFQIDIDTVHSAATSDAYYTLDADDEGIGWKFSNVNQPEESRGVDPRTQIVDLYSIYFAGVNGSITKDTVDPSFFELATGSDMYYSTGWALANTETAPIEGATLTMTGFPVVKDPEYTQVFEVYPPNGEEGDVLHNARVQAYDATSGAPVGDYADTDEYGKATLSLPVGTYKYDVTYAGTNTAYTGAEVDWSSDKTTAKTGFTVNDDEDDDETITVQMKLPAEGSHSIQIKVVDGDNDNEAIPGAKVTLGGDQVYTTDSSGMITNIPSLAADDYSLNATATSYEDYAGSTSTTLTIDSDGVATLPSAYNGKYTFKNGLLTLIMSSKKYQITIPVPVPEGLTADEAAQKGKLMVTISANTDPDATTPATLKLPITLTVSDDAVSDYIAVTPTSGAVAVTDIDAIVSLPKGNYMVTVSGAGLEELETELNIVPEGTSVHVNLGGTVDPNGVVNGGYTDTTDGTAINLGDTSTSATTNGVISSTGSNTGGSQAGGGALSNSSYSGLTSVGTITVPAYYAVGYLDNDNQQMKVDVYIDNVKANMGTFGITYDTSLFSSCVGELVQPTDAPIDWLPVQNMAVGTEATLTNPEAATGYHAFVWQIKDDGTGVWLDATESEIKIATYTLGVKDANTIESAMHNRAIYIMPYSDTVNGKAILESYTGDDEDFGKLMLGSYWRATDFNNDDIYLDGSTDPIGDLDASLSLEDGFFQVYTKDAEENTYNVDAMTQFTYDYNGSVAVNVEVKGADGAALPNATVYAYTQGAAIGDHTLAINTDSTGKITFPWPENTNLYIRVEEKDHLDYPDETNTEEHVVTTESVNISVQMTKREGHPVKLEEPDTAAKAVLLGEPKAYNSVDYYFSLEPAPGYQWPIDDTTGLPKMPAPTELEATLYENDNIAVIRNPAITWEPAENRYKISGDDITGAPATSGADAGNIIIAIKDEVLAEIEPTATYTVTATAGVGGTVNGEAGPKTITETLSGGTTTSSAYTFLPTGDNVINKIVINGTQITPTEAQRSGFTHTFTNVSSDQSIVVNFGEKDPETGEIIPTPDDTDAIVTVTVGDYGSAVVNDDTDNKLVGPVTGSYTVAVTDGLKVAIEAEQDVVQPDATLDPVDYVIDKVYVNGVEVADARLENDTTAEIFGDYYKATLNLDENDLTVGGVTEVIITFRPAKSDENDPENPIQAVVKTAVKKGLGTIVATGTTVCTIGDRPTFTITPDSASWEVEHLYLVEPGAEEPGQDVKGNIDAATGEYQVPALKEGITLLNVHFAEKAKEVVVTVDLNSDVENNGYILQGTTVNVKFERTAGGEAISFDQNGTINVSNTATLYFDVPDGTWTVTVTKNGFLRSIYTGFVMDSNLDNDDTYSIETNAETGARRYFFGRAKADEQASAKAIVPIIGDADRDSIIISLDDVAQVVNGLIKNAGDAEKQRADFTADGNATEEMRFVKYFYGTIRSLKPYSDLLAK